MEEQIKDDVRVLAGLVLAQGNLITSLLGIMQNRGLIDQADINEIIDLALVGAEAAPNTRPDVRASMRRVLENYSEMMGGPVA